MQEERARADPTLCRGGFLLAAAPGPRRNTHSCGPGSANRPDPSGSPVSADRVVPIVHPARTPVGALVSADRVGRASEDPTHRRGGFQPAAPPGPRREQLSPSECGPSRRSGDGLNRNGRHGVVAHLQAGGARLWYFVSCVLIL